jgi:hypothetical protein
MRSVFKIRQQHAEALHRLLRARAKRPTEGRAAKGCDEFAPPHAHLV